MKDLGERYRKSLGDEWDDEQVEKAEYEIKKMSAAAGLDLDHKEYLKLNQSLEEQLLKISQEQKSFDKFRQLLREVSEDYDREGQGYSILARGDKEQTRADVRKTAEAHNVNNLGLRAQRVLRYLDATPTIKMAYAKKFGQAEKSKMLSQILTMEKILQKNEDLSMDELKEQFRQVIETSNERQLA
jgi:hypothetical protein